MCVVRAREFPRETPAKNRYKSSVGINKNKWFGIGRYTQKE